MNIAVIPARGGSKRIPRKNIKEFHGQPMISYAIEAAKASGCFDKIIVSTDDEEIKDVAIKYGAEVPFLRPESLSDDYATTMDVINHAIKWFVDNEHKVENVCCLYATAPFVTAKYLQCGLELLTQEGKNHAFAFSATTFPFPIQRAFAIRNSGVAMFNPEHLNTRSQDLEEAYHDAGQFYWGRASSFLEKKPFFGKDSVPVLLPRKMVQDIDTNEDWELAELLFRVLKNEDCNKG